MNTRLFQQAFAGGEISPLMHLRLSDTKNRTGAARLRNMVVTPTGAAVRRPGTRFIREVKDSTKKSVVRRFAYSATEQLALEIGVGYFRFHTDASTVTYVTPHTVASVNTTTEVITFTEAHGYTGSESVRFLYGAGSSLPGVDASTTYTVATVPTTTTLTLTGVNLTGAVTGTVHLIDAAEMPETYVDSETVTLNGGTDVVTFATAHAFANNDPVSLTSTDGAAGLPDELPPGTVFYIRDLSGSGAGSTCTLAATLGGSVHLFTGNGTGTISLHYAYDVGDLVHTPGAGVYYVEVDVPAGDPANFYLQDLTECIFEIPNSYVESNLYHLKFRQQNAVLTITHPDHAPLQLTRISEVHWTSVPISTYGATLDVPAISSITRVFGEYWNVTIPAGSPTFTTTGAKHTLGPLDAVYLEGAIGVGSQVVSSLPAGVYLINDAPNSLSFTLRTLAGGTSSNTSGGLGTGVVRRVSASSENSETYVVTALTDDGEETAPSAESTASYNPLFVSGSSNTVNWTAVSGAARYRVYKKQTGIFGFIGETEDTSFKDDNITPDLGITPPRLDDTLDSPGHPGCSTYFEQRTVYSGKESDAQRIWLTRTGSESTLSYHLPVIDTDRINFTLAAPESCYVQHVVPQSNLLVLTSAVEFVVTPVNTDAITPTSFRARPVSYVGSSHVAPLMVNNTLLFCAARGGHVRELGRVAEQGYATGDVSLRAAHLFDGKTIVDSALMKAPYPIAWFVSSDGTLLGCTYAPEEELGGWHWHDTQGTFESVCCVSEGTEDALYFVVKRTINEVDVRYIERMEPFAEQPRGFEWHVDCGLIYTGSAALTVAGLDHLEGATVQVLRGVHVGNEVVVASGSITSASASTIFVIGLGYDSELQTLPVVMQIDAAFGRGRTHNINKLWVRVANSYRFEAGPAQDQLVPSLDIALSELADAIDIDIHIPGDWTDTGQVWIRQTDPVPLTVVALCAEVSIGS